MCLVTQVVGEGANGAVCFGKCALREGGEEEKVAIKTIKVKGKEQVPVVLRAS